MPVLASPSIQRLIRLALPLLALPALSACDQLGIETPAKATERIATESKAIGSACRHAMRAIEDCYTLNPKADKSAVFGGWREMDEYMRENKLDGVAPVVPRPPPEAPSKPKKGKAAASKPSDAEEGADEAEAKPAKDEDAAAAEDEPKPKKGKAAH
jgi:hypothetical protein